MIPTNTPIETQLLDQFASTSAWPAVFNSSMALKVRDPVSLCHDLLLGWAMVSSKSKLFAHHPRVEKTFDAAQKQLGILSISPNYLAAHLKTLQQRRA